MNTYGTEVSATLIGERTEDGWKHDLWSVTLTRHGVVRDAITFEFRTGVGHRRTRNGCSLQRVGNYETLWTAKGKVCTHVVCQTQGVKPVPPSLYEVLCSLKADDTQGETFADWCANYGYDTDSIKARETYFACQESENRSRRFFGADWPTIQEDEDYT